MLEFRYHRDVERPHGLPAGTRQAHFRVGSRNAYRDRLYDQYLTVVELDGRATHTIDKRWDDIRRDNATSAGGILTLRYGWLDTSPSSPARSPPKSPSPCPPGASWAPGPAHPAAPSAASAAASPPDRADLALGRKWL